VEVLEGAASNPDPISYRGQCNEGCTLTSSAAQDGWDFVGTLSCTALYAGGNPTNPQTALHAVPATTPNPVVIQLGNCD
jgi:hypothetical protein